MRSSRGRLLWVLLAAALVLFLVAVVAAAIYVILSRQQATTATWGDPIGEIDPDAIAADLALYPLAGASELETIDAAIENGELETAFSTLAFSPELSDVQRIGRLILLGERFAEMGADDRASLSYRLVYDSAILSPRLNDPARSDALLAMGNGWVAIGQETLALNAYDQVYMIAVHSPYIQMAHRRELLNLLEAAYLGLGDREQAGASREQMVELEYATDRKTLLPSFESPDLPGETEAVSSADVGALEDARRQAVYTLLQAVADGADPPSGLVNNVAQALLAEDEAKLGLYRQELEGTTQPGRRINVQRHLIRWLLLKYKVAARGNGLSLVPEWEGQLADIQSELTKAYEGLFFDYEDFVTALPDAALMVPGSYKTRRIVILAGRLGHYPNYPAEQLAGKLQDAVLGLIGSGSLEELYVDAATEDGGPRFFLSPSEAYGRAGEEP
jgi:hypothetical protein